MTKNKIKDVPGQVNLFANVSKLATRTFYVVRLSRPSQKIDRYALYEYNPKTQGMDVIWPNDSHLMVKAKLWPYQVYSERHNYPAYHFALDFTSLGEFAHELAQFLKCKVVLSDLKGHKADVVTGIFQDG